MKKLLYTLFGLSLLTLVLYKDNLHYTYLKLKTEQSIFIITNAQQQGHGTGFQINLPSGKKAILTNAHVCAVKDDKNQVYIVSNYARLQPRRVLEESIETDLCLVEGVETLPALSLGKDYNDLQTYYTIGYPYDYPLNITKGYILGTDKVKVLDRYIEDPNDKCDLPKNLKEKYPTLFGEIEVCLIYINTIITNIQGFPGNSGSPLVNKYGNVVGVNFASNNKTNYMIVVPLDHITKFLTNY